MSGQGSSSFEAAVRIEAYLDDRPEAVQVLTAPPFRFRLDPATLEEGEHRLRLVRIDASGSRSERVIPFTVEHGPGLEVRGLEPGATVSGSVDVDVLAPSPPRPPAPAAPTTGQGPSAWLTVLATIVILGGIWVFFMVVPLYSRLVPAPSAGTATASSGQPSAPVDQALLKAGGTLYSSDCAACHQPTGEGMPPTFPALAGNSFLSDASAVVKRIYDGAGAMPSHHGYSAKQLAEVATYVRNTWGNSYGGVSVAEVSKAVPQASGSSSSGSAPSSSGSATASASAGAGSSAASGAPAASGASASPAAASGSAASGAGASSSSPSSTSTASSAPASSAASASSAPAPAMSAAMAAGKKVYQADCQGCHQPNGAGLPPTFPKLAGNAYLSNATNVVARIFDGKGTMPSHHSYSAKKLADVATYIRNAFGNDFGPVSLAQAEQAAPKAAR